MKFTTLDYKEKEYELVTIAFDDETTDWWLIDEWGDLIRADRYDVAECEVVGVFDFDEISWLLPKEERLDPVMELADYYYMLEQDKWL